jgi:hypothetical protein
VAKFEHMISCEDEYKARRAQVRARLQWIKEGDEPSKFYFDCLNMENLFEIIRDL